MMWAWSWRPFWRDLECVKERRRLQICLYFCSKLLLRLCWFRGGLFGRVIVVVCVCVCVCAGVCVCACACACACACGFKRGSVSCWS